MAKIELDHCDQIYQFDHPKSHLYNKVQSLLCSYINQYTEVEPTCHEKKM